MPLIGLEPIRRLERGILSPLCLPIPPQRHRTYDIISQLNQNVNNFKKIKSGFFLPLLKSNYTIKLAINAATAAAKATTINGKPLYAKTNATAVPITAVVTFPVE